MNFPHRSRISERLAGAVPLQFLNTMRDYPPRQTPGSFNLDSVMKQIEEMSRMEN